MLTLWSVLAVWTSQLLIHYFRSLRTLQVAGDVYERSCHGLERLQRTLRQCQPLPNGEHRVEELTLQTADGTRHRLVARSGHILLDGVRIGPAPQLVLNVSTRRGRKYLNITWQLPDGNALGTGFEWSVAR